MTTKSPRNEYSTSSDGVTCGLEGALLSCVAKHDKNRNKHKSIISTNMKRIRLLLGCVLIICLSLSQSMLLTAQEDLVAEMNGAYATGAEFNLWVSSRSGSIRVDYGSGSLTELQVSTDPSLPTKINSYTTEGKSVKVYGRDLTALRCFWNKLTSLTLHAPELEVLICHTNSIPSLDLTGSPKLRILDATEAGLTTIQMNGLTLIDTLVCDGNELTQLDLSGMTHLKLLECYKNKLSQLNLTSCADLVKVSAHKNQLTTLNVSGLTKLEEVSCWRNKIAELDLSSAATLSALDCSENSLTKLLVSPSAPIKKIELYDNQLSEEAFNSFIKSLPNLSGQESGTLKAVKTSTATPEGNQVSSQALLEAQSKNWRIYKGYEEIPVPTPVPHATLTTSGVSQWTISAQLADESQQDKVWIDWNNDGICQDNERGLPDGKHDVEAKTITIYGDLESLFCYENALTDIDVSSLQSLKSLNISDNSLTQIDLSHNPLIEELWMQNNQFTTIDLSHQPALDNLNASNNKLTEITFAPQSATNRIDLSNNKLTTIDLSNTPHLALLNCNDNQLTEFDGRLVGNLSFLYLANNQFKAFDPTNLPELIELNLNGNHLSNINLKGLDWLTKLLLAGNNISTIDLTGCPDLAQLNLAENPITDLDLTPCGSIFWLNLSACGLSSVDVTSLSYLSMLYLPYNKLTQLTLPTECEELVALDIEGNQIRGDNMQALIDQLPNKEYGVCEFYVVAQDSLYGNAISRNQVETLLQKSWKVFQSTKSEPKYIEFAGYTMCPIHLTVGEHGSASIVNYQPYSEVPMGVRLQLSVTPEAGYKIQSILVNGKPLEGMEFEVLKETAIEVLFQKETALQDPTDASVALYPNPATDYITVCTAIGSTIELFASDGSLVATTQATQPETTLSVAQLPAGHYVARITEHNGEMRLSPVIIQ